ncbi:uncharacterized protein HMPREF1541_11148, partial [Cyphellophora europaea CBS 101466]
MMLSPDLSPLPCCRHRRRWLSESDLQPLLRPLMTSRTAWLVALLQCFTSAMAERHGKFYPLE